MTYEPLQKFIVDAFEALKTDDESEQLEFFRDLGEWRDKYLLLQDTVAFLVATSDAAVGQVFSTFLRLVRMSVLPSSFGHIY